MSQIIKIILVVAMLAAVGHLHPLELQGKSSRTPRDFDDLTVDEISVLLERFQSEWTGREYDKYRISLHEYMRWLERNNPTRSRQIREHMSRNR